MKNKIFIVVLACLTLLPSFASAREMIESFDSLLQVQTDGAIIVTETLKVRHEGDKIRRGIYRDLPTKNGEKYELIGVKRDGAEEPSFVEKSSGYYRINTGDDSFLPYPRTSVFEIKYKVWNIPQAFEGYDEVYWNVTGNKWSFPIEEVSAVVELPIGADIIQESSYIGYEGSTKSAKYEGNGKFTGDFLNKGEQFTIAVGFTPGIVSIDKVVLMSDKIKYALLFIMYFVYLIYLLSIWHKKGRDPVARTVMPQYEAPKELTAAQASYLYNKNIASNILAISFIQMIMNGFLKLTVKQEKTLFASTNMVYVFEKQDKEPTNIEEKSINLNKMELDGNYSMDIKHVDRMIKYRIEDTMKPYLARNQLYIIIPTIVCILIMLGISWLDGLLWGENLLPLSIFSIIIGITASTLTFRTLVKQIMFAIVAFCFFIHFMCIATNGNLIQTLVFALTISTSVIFAYLMHQPTEKGQRLIEYLEGLKMFLKATKAPTEHPQELEEKLNPKNMETLFPYAMALGMEEEWEKKFKKYFGEEEYKSFVRIKPYMSGSFIKSFTSSVSKSSGSKSGSGGGGRAGGGRGGGGGGGR